jgi:hypothetical protein
MCFACAAAGRVHALLAESTDEIPARLAPLAAALLSAGTGQAVCQWLRPRKPTAALIAQIAGTSEPVTHGLLDRLPQGHAVHRLRAVLMHAQVLPQPRRLPGADHPLAR